jgi:hypothetical protein
MPSVACKRDGHQVEGRLAALDGSLFAQLTWQSWTLVAEEHKNIFDFKLSPCSECRMLSSG